MPSGKNVGTHHLGSRNRQAEGAHYYKEKKNNFRTVHFNHHGTINNRLNLMLYLLLK